MQELTREQIDHLIESGDAAGAWRALERFWDAAPGPASAGFVVSRFEKLRPSLDLKKCKLAILRSFTLEPVVPLVRALAFLAGIDLDVWLGDFGAYVQDILNVGGKLYEFAADVVIVAVRTPDIAPDLWDHFANSDDRARASAPVGSTLRTDLSQPGEPVRSADPTSHSKRGDVSVSDPSAAEQAVAQTLTTFHQLIHTFRQHSAAHLIIHTLETPATPTMGLLDSRGANGQLACIGQINEGLAGLARDAKNVYVLDYNALIARRGHVAWHDERKWLIARMPIAANELVHLAREWMRFLHPMAGKTCKVLAVDLDNTLWGGVIGEDGIDGIKLDDAWPGAAYRALQRAILDLHQRGVMLAVCSKNNPAEAMEALEKHPGMLVRPRHFSALSINWTEKASCLRDLAKELNVGLDSIAFLDDNPVEREWVREQLPEITVIDLPADPMLFAGVLRACPVFERLELTGEDQSRSRFYAEQRLRTELRQGAASLEDFYRSLQMQVRIEPVSPKTLSRAAQLTQKTNQFNLTTRRYSDAQLSDLIASPNWKARTIQVIDRFGDSGIVGVALLRLDGTVAEIDTFLLSCRVIGRTVETAFLSVLADEARQAGAVKLIGSFIPTKKNAPSAEFYKEHGFTGTKQSDGSSRWEFSLTENSLIVPSWIEVLSTESGSDASGGHPA